MAKFKEGDWVYTYDEIGLVYKNQVRGNIGFLYLLTGRHEPVNTEYVFKTKKECLKAMKDAGIQKASLHMATVIKLENKIADLEAKLAESEKAIKYLKGIKRYDIGEMLTENAKLKQQLAEKEKKLQFVTELKAKELGNALTILVEHLTGYISQELDTATIIDIIQRHNQDKISFAVEKLEKVGQEFSMRVGITDNNIDLLNEIIDNQIKQLKEKK